MNNNNEQENHTNIHQIYYQNQFSGSYKTDERVLKNIISNNVKCNRETDKLQLIIYYKSNTIKNLVSRKNLTPKQPELKRTNVIYEYKCNVEDCELRSCSYIGMTTTTLSRRLTMHLANGGPKTHTSNHHNMQITREMLVNNTQILRFESDNNRLQITEALLINLKNPSINNQVTGSQRTLKLI